MTEQSLLNPARKPSVEGAARAAEKIAAILPATPLLPLEVDGHAIWCKAECLQPIGAFKIRGGWHRLTDMDEQQRAKGVVAFSSGNHAQGVAWAARRLGIAAVIIMPEDAPAAKMQATADMDAKIITYDRLNGSREQIAADIAADTGATIVSSFDDPWIIEGQGSAGMELRAQMLALTGEEPDQIIACCGGGGLASGCALANPQADIVVVEPEGWDDMAHSLMAGEIVPVAPNPPFTICDALQTLRVSPLTFDILSKRNARGFHVTEAEVEHAMRVAFSKLQLVVEPGGAVALAAVLAGKVDITGNAVVTLSGGNVDPALFARIIAS
ncbi:threonine/serine dehydratase [Sphingorhabdus sp. Alg239-R122]|uniref:threonine ammonia-lyase n=1 Tax=Sphingorhabdus sp. Alg239-R122 TaxID=2305989 RepID=UPI0013DB7018|nr:threonine/serine dehydratase [Sphingorhabdus sp. Alg239-R122]